MKVQRGDLRESILLEPRLSRVPDNLGNLRQEFGGPASIRCRALYLMRPGSEATIDARMQGVQPIDVIIEWTQARAASVTPEWRMTDTRTGQVYAISAVADMDRRRQWLTLSVTTGKRP